VPALAFADLPRDAPEGVRAYASPPVVLDSINRGALTGKRVDRIIYMFGVTMPIVNGAPFAIPVVAPSWSSSVTSAGARLRRCRSAPLEWQTKTSL
jgi:hypothetical protein